MWARSVAPDGRLAFAINTQKNLVYIIDAALDRVIQTAYIGSGPDQVTFSDELAFIRLRDDETVWMTPLDTLGQEGHPVSIIDFPGGQHPFGQATKSSPADSIVQAPGADAVLVANPADRAIYYYKEGMAAPMGSFNNWAPTGGTGRRPQPEGARPGSYETVARLGRSGRHARTFYLEQSLDRALFRRHSRGADARERPPRQGRMPSRPVKCDRGQAFRSRSDCRIRSPGRQARA